MIHERRVLDFWSGVEPNFLIDRGFRRWWSGVEWLLPERARGLNDRYEMGRCRWVRKGLDRDP